MDVWACGRNPKDVWRYKDGQGASMKKTFIQITCFVVMKISISSIISSNLASGIDLVVSSVVTYIIPNKTHIQIDKDTFDMNVHVSINSFQQVHAQAKSSELNACPSKRARPHSRLCMKH